jgi:hypothetical protein
MKELLDKISSYNLFNYLLPGIIFAVLAKSTTPYNFIQSDIVIGVFTYYFMGLVISRIGSVILEPIFKKLLAIKFAPYADFISALTKDAKLEIISEANNMYRTFCSLFLLLILLNIYDAVVVQYPLLNAWSSYILVGALFVLFVFAYRKQTQYIVKRVETAKKELS